MPDRVFVRHPDQPERNGYVSQAAFDALWSKKGFVIDDPDQVTSDDLNAELDRRAGIEPPQEPSETSSTAPVDEKADLTAFLEGRGVVVDGRWGIKRLRSEAAAFEQSPDLTCSVCDAPAVYEIEGAPEEKGNLACEGHRGMWPLSQARRLSDEDFD